MKQFILLILLCLPLSALAQSEWQRPLTPSERQEKAKREKAPKTTTEAPNEKDAPYIGAGVVPEVDGRVVFTLDTDVPGRTAESIYRTVYAALDSLSMAEEQIESSIVLFNETEHAIVGKYNEWLTFSSHALSLDRTRFKYTVFARCTDQHLHLTLERLSYAYEERRDTPLLVSAEDWITDAKAVNKKGTALRVAQRKFRRCTVDRVNSLFGTIRQALGQSK